MRRIRFLAVAASMAFVASPSWAADTAPPPAPKADKLAAARAQIAQKNWAGALTELKNVNATGDADWNNLMGYTTRKSATPDLAAAGKYYDEALRINPQHRGALEYSGELYLMTNELPKAEQRLATLDKACTLPCEEHTALKKAVERYKANGNKYVAAPGDGAPRSTRTLIDPPGGCGAAWERPGAGPASAYSSPSCVTNFVFR